jgi:3-methylcrotonyl-CoA carboxylase alpha subunit
MEMNTRLQVEHPVTEAITGTDLVEWQLRVAAGEPLPKTQAELVITGHALEARLYAEDPSHGFLPSIGPLRHLRLPDNLGRVDTGVSQGDEVSPHYDPMIAKLIHHAPTRKEAVSGLAGMVAACQIWPVRTNAGFLAKALLDEDFGRGEVDTGMIARKGEAWLPPVAPSQNALQAAARAALPKTDLPGAWGKIGLRLNQAPAAPCLRLVCDGHSYEVEITPHEAGLTALPDDSGWSVSESGQTFHLAPWRPLGDDAGPASGAIHAPMPGMVIAVDVRPGDSVEKGQKLLVLEAMKMEQALTAPFAGIVRELNVSVGQQIAADALLVHIEEVKD